MNNRTARPSPALSDFSDDEGCRAWLAQQPLTNAAQLHPAFLAQLIRLNGRTLPVVQRLKMLERLREPVAFVQTDYARRFARRPLPLAAAEDAALAANRALWQALCEGYRLCLQACLKGDNAARRHAPLVARHALDALAAEQFDLCLAAYEADNSLWQRLHSVYGATEQLGLLEPKVQSTYVQTLLLQMASPFELSARQLRLAQRWLRRWSTRVTLAAQAPGAANYAPLWVDLAVDRPPRRDSGSGPQVRWLDISALAHRLKKRIVGLQRGESPAALKLGEDVQPAECEVLLRHLYDHCCKGGIARREPRREPAAEWSVVSGIESIYRRLAGSAFRQPGSVDTLSAQDHERIALFGHVATRPDEGREHFSAQALERWQALNDSAEGLHLARPLQQPGAAIITGNLIGVGSDARTDANGIVLGAVRWSMIRTDMRLHVGTALFPGVPEAVAMRLIGAGTTSKAFQPGFMLPAVAALSEPATLILPTAWFRAGRVIEIHQRRSYRVRLTCLCQRGADFERAQYETL